MAADLETAYYLAARGFYIAPLKYNSKEPEGFWKELSTVDFPAIRRMFLDVFEEVPLKLNILCDAGKSGFTIIDLDEKDGRNGIGAWAKLTEDKEVPRTFTVRTPSGGLHLYFQASGYRNSASKLAPGIDIRGEGGYVVAPSSYVVDEKHGYEGVYTIEDGSEIAAMPEWLHETFSAWRVSTLAASTGRVAISDDPGDIQWAIDFLEQHEPAIEGAGGDAHTFTTFCRLKERGLSRETAIDLANVHWNGRCSPPWDYEDLAKKAENAYRFSHNGTGVKSGAAEFHVPQVAVANGLNFELLRAPSYRSEFEIPRRQWVFGDLAIRQQLTVIGAAPGVGKSTLSLLFGLSKGSGRDVCGINPRGQGRVAIYNNEDGIDEIERRALALLKSHGLTWNDVRDPDVAGKLQRPFLYLSSGEDNPFRIAKRLPKTGRLEGHHADAMVKELTAKNIDWLMCDPLAETHPAKENESEEMGEIARMYRWVAHKADCAITLVHHTRKHDNASSEGHSGNLDTLRGSSALAGVARFVFTLFPMNKKQAKDYGIPEREMWRYLLLEQAKANMAPGNANRMWFRKSGETLGVTEQDPDGEKVGVIHRHYLQEADPMEDINPATKTLVMDIEALVGEKLVGVAEIARELTEAFPFHSGKNPRTLERAIHRLFDDDGCCLGVRGVLHLQNVKMGSARPVNMVRLELHEGVGSITDML